MKKNKKTYLIFLIGFIISLIGFITSFVMYQKQNLDENVPEEIVTGDLVFNFLNDHKSVYIDKAVPTLDKFGVLNESFIFSVKNTNSISKEYSLYLQDDNSTIMNKYIRYELTKNDEVLGIFSLNSDGKIDTGPINSNEEIKYGLKLWLDYNSDIKVGRLSKKIMIQEGIVQDIETINEPELAGGMIPVYYDEKTNSWHKSSIEKNWYNYDEQKWANAVTVSKEKREEYLNASVGTKILMEDINSMWVWVPRFTYELKDKSIIVRFVSTKDNAYSAFKFNNEDLSGFWISKFEGSISEESTCVKTGLTKDCNNQNNVVYFKPNGLLMNKITMANLFYTYRKMELKNNIYGFSSNGKKINNDGTITGDDNNLDIHMLKNSEWQAVALLSDSKYGKRGNVKVSDDKKLIYSNNTNYSGKSSIYGENYDYNSPNGEGASTTGNVYGIYDMSGGRREYVMINNESINILDKKSNSGFNNSVKGYYYDNDSLESDSTLILKDKYTNNSLINSEPLTRGGYKINGDIFSIYGVSDYLNKISNETNSRACLIVSKEENNG